MQAPIEKKKKEIGHFIVNACVNGKYNSKEAKQFWKEILCMTEKQEAAVWE